jgi:hypothetical protein
MIITCLLFAFQVQTRLNEVLAAPAVRHTKKAAKKPSTTKRKVKTEEEDKNPKNSKNAKK